MDTTPQSFHLKLLASQERFHSSTIAEMPRLAGGNPSEQQPRFLNRNLGCYSEGGGDYGFLHDRPSEAGTWRELVMNEDGLGWLN